MLVRFWGVRGSLPTPIRSETIRAKIIEALHRAKGVDLNDEEAIEVFVDDLPFEIKGTCGGNTSCVEVLTEKEHIILDAGSGFRELGLNLMSGEFGEGRGSLHVFISHTHWDHIQGFPYFIPAFVAGNRIRVYSPKKDIADRFTSQQIDQDMHPIAVSYTHLTLPTN